MKLRLLFLCTGNSCRSQMAEGWTRHLHGDRFDVASAGLTAHGLNPHAVRVMSEAGVDISRQTSKTLADLADQRFDLVITVCGHAAESCPMFPGTTKKLHIGFDDPPKLAQNAANEEEALGHYRRVRDEIRQCVATLPEHPIVQSLLAQSSAPIDAADTEDEPDFFEGHGVVYDSIRQLSPREAYELLKRGAVLVDVRDEAEMNGKYFQIPGLIYIESRHLKDRYERLPLDKPLIIADSVGLKGKEAVRFLQSKGYTRVANINGGIFAWEDEKLPMTIKEEEILAGECACRLRPRKTYRPKSGTGC